MEHLATIAQIWTGGYPPAKPRAHSPVEKLVYTPLICCRLLSLDNLRYFFPSAGKAFMDGYVLVFAALLSLLALAPVRLGTVGPWLAVYRVFDIVTYRLYFLLVKSQDRPWRQDVLRRSVAIILINFYETVLAYAVLYLNWAQIVSTTGEHQQLASRLAALYYSATTITTLGYGDFVPGDDSSRFLVLTQLLCAVLFLIFLIPALVSLFSTEAVAD